MVRRFGNNLLKMALPPEATSFSRRQSPPLDFSSLASRLSPFVSRLSPLVSRLSPLVSRLSSLASRLSPLKTVRRYGRFQVEHQKKAQP